MNCLARGALILLLSFTATMQAQTDQSGLPPSRQIIGEIRSHHEGLAVWWTGHNGWLIKADSVLIGNDLVLEAAERLQQSPLTTAELAGELDEVIRRMSGDEAPARAVGHKPVRPALAPAKPRPVAPRSLPAARPKAVKALPAKSAPHAPAKPVAPVPAKSASSGAGGASCSMDSGILVWDDSLRIGIKDIDAQHQILVRMICDLHEAMRTGKGKAQVEQVVKGLEDYAVEHFGFEEGLMKKYKYPGYVHHRKEHDAFVEKVMAFGEEFRAGKVALTNEVMNFLKNWLVGHIKSTDRKYAPFFKERGL